jgi:hypothetical protein
MIYQDPPDFPACDICGYDAFMTVSGLLCWTHAPRCAGCGEVLRDPCYDEHNQPCAFRGSDAYAETMRGLVHVGCMVEGEEIA